MRNGIVCLFISVVLIVVSGCASVNQTVEDAKTSVLSKALAQVKLFAGLTGAERDALKAAATLRQGKAGECLIEQGKTSGKMFIVLDGDVDVHIDGKLFVTLTGQPLIGEIEFLDGQSATATVLLRKQCSFIEIENAALTLLMDKQPRLGYVIMREIAKIEAQRLRKTSTKKK